MNNTSTTVGIPTFSKPIPCRIQIDVLFEIVQQFHENRRRPKCGAATPPASLRQTYPLPNPNRCSLRNRRACHAPPTLCLPRWLSGPLRIEVQSARQAQDLDPLRALSPARGAHFFLKTTLSPRCGAHFACPSRGGPHPGLAKLRSRLRAVPNFSKNDTLASAACSFCHPRRSGALSGLSKMTLSLTRGAHFQK